MGATSGTGGPSRRGRGAGAVLHNPGQGHHDGRDGSGAPGRAALELLRAQPEALASCVSGLQWLDAEVPLDGDTQVELLGRDAHGTPVLVLDCGSGGLPLARIGAVCSALERSAPLLQRMHAAHGLDLQRPPLLLLLAARFPDSLPGQLDLLDRLDLAALEYRVVSRAGGARLLDLALLHRTSGGGRLSPGRPASALAPAAGLVPDGDASREPDELSAAELEPLGAGDAPAPDVRSAPRGQSGGPRDADEDADDEPLDPEEVFDHLRATISSLSDGVLAQEAAPGRVEFRLGGELLAVLEWAEHGASLRVPAAGDELLAVSDSASLDAALNALFPHFFRRVQEPG